MIQGTVKLEIEETTFRLQDYQDFLTTNAESISTFKTQQQSAFSAERDRWVLSGEFDRVSMDTTLPDISDFVLSEGQQVISSQMYANIWKILVKPGDSVQVGDPLIILESMKMEIEVEAPFSGTIETLLCQPGQSITAGQPLIISKTKSPARVPPLV